MNAILEFRHSFLVIFFPLIRFELAYSHWESYLKLFSLRTFIHLFNTNNYYQNNADIVTMEYIWIDVYGYFLSIRQHTGVFVGKILHFHHKLVLDVVSHALTAVGHKIKRIQNHLCRLGMQLKLASKSVWNVCERESVLMLPTRTKYEIYLSNMISGKLVVLFIFTHPNSNASRLVHDEFMFNAYERRRNVSFTSIWSSRHSNNGCRKYVSSAMFCIHCSMYECVCICMCR